MSTPTLLDRARAILAAAGGATARPWRWWTSNSFLRLSSDATRKDGDVLHGTVHPIDKHPDVVCSEADREFLVGACNSAEGLAAFAVEFARALPGLYREHTRGRNECHVVSYGEDTLCNCGADDHNALLDDLADKLGIPPEERRR